MDFLRPFVLPVFICLFVITMWKAASYKREAADAHQGRHAPNWVVDNDEPVAAADPSAVH